VLLDEARDLAVGDREGEVLVLSSVLPPRWPLSRCVATTVSSPSDLTLWSSAANVPSLSSKSVP
jgi:hypothetical protein